MINLEVPSTWNQRVSYVLVNVIIIQVQVEGKFQQTSKSYEQATCKVFVIPLTFTAANR